MADANLERMTLEELQDIRARCQRRYVSGWRLVPHWPWPESAPERDFGAAMRDVGRLVDELEATVPGLRSASWHGDVPTVTDGRPTFLGLWGHALLRAATIVGMVGLLALLWVIALPVWAQWLCVFIVIWVGYGLLEVESAGRGVADG